MLTKQTQTETHKRTRHVLIKFDTVRDHPQPMQMLRYMAFVSGEHFFSNPEMKGARALLQDSESSS